MQEGNDGQGPSITTAWCADGGAAPAAGQCARDGSSAAQTCRMVSTSHKPPCSSPNASEQLATQPHYAGAPWPAHKAASKKCCYAQHGATDELKACARCTSSCLRAVQPQCSPIIHDSSSGAGSQLLLADLLAGRRSEADPPVGTVVLQTAEGPSVSRNRVHGLQHGSAEDTGRTLKRAKLYATVCHLQATVAHKPAEHKLNGSHCSPTTPRVACSAQL